MWDEHNRGYAKSNPENLVDRDTSINIEGWVSCLTGKHCTSTYLKYPIPPLQADLHASVKSPFRRGLDISSLSCEI